jgi:hypothetical protein
MLTKLLLTPTPEVVLARREAILKKASEMQKQTNQKQISWMSESIILPVSGFPITLGSSKKSSLP